MDRREQQDKNEVKKSLVEMNRRELAAFLERFLLRLAFEPRAYYMAYIISITATILSGAHIDEGVQCGLLAAFAAAALSF